MHSISHNGVTFHFNSDFSGDLIISKFGCGDCHVPVDALEALLAEFLRRKAVEKIESMGDQELLNKCFG